MIDMEWKDGSGETFTVTSRSGKRFMGEYKDLAFYKVTDSNGNVISAERYGNDRIGFSTEEGKTYFIIRE